MTLAADSVNAAGGVAHRQIELVPVYYDEPTPPEALQELAESVAADEGYVAAIGPGSSADLLQIADRFAQHRKPLVSFTSTSAEVLRAYGGQGFLWRTRESDIAQTELLLRYAQTQGAKRLALLTSAAPDGYTFFSWFGFFANELGYGSDAIQIALLDGPGDCRAVVQQTLRGQPDLIVFAVGRDKELECVVRELDRGQLSASPRLLIADTGFDTRYTLDRLGALAEGVEGFSAVSDALPPFEDRFAARFGQASPPHGASEHDAVLLLAYGLAASGGQGHELLIQGLQTAVDGREGTYSWEAEGVAATLSALSAGQHPNLAGATGRLEFEPQLYTDLASSKLAHWVQRGGQRKLDERYDTSTAGFLTGQRALVRGSPELAQDLAVSGSGWMPSQDKRELWAVIAALSSGWSNYRHQADALRQYQLLRKNGVPDDHIVLVMADDIATAAKNPLPGVVRNEIDGANLRSAAQIDYGLSLSPAQLMDILAGRASAQTPTVVHTTDASNLYVYLVGHGGQAGMPIGAKTTSDGLSGDATALVSPQLLRQTLCQLRTTGQLRRGLVVLESCFSGAFGAQAWSGLDSGCDGLGGSPLDGVVLISAATSNEVSFAATYDSAVGAWLSDQFSRELARFAEASPSASLSALYRATYVAVPGSHVSLFNSQYAGRLSDVTLAEFWHP